MHKPIFVFAIGEDKDEAESTAEDFVDRMIEGNTSFDWRQGIKESGRWDNEINQFDGAVEYDDKAKEFVMRTIVENQDDILKKIKEGNEKIAKLGTNDLSSTLGCFALASSELSSNIFDSTGWTTDGVCDFQTLEQIIKEAGDEKLWLVGFDVHF